MGLSSAALILVVLLQGQFMGFGSVINGVAASSLNKDFSKARDATMEPRHGQYQYIILGGGTAGCGLAATLSAHYKVLLLERAARPTTTSASSASRGGQISCSTIPTQNEELVPGPTQAFRSADGVYNRRARVLGGGSAINAGFYSRASTAEVQSAQWDPIEVEKAYEWVEEKIVSPASLGPWQSAFKRSLLEAGVTPDNGRTFEHIRGTNVGSSIFDSTGRRHTAANLLSSANADLLTVLTFATVRRILFDVSNASQPPLATGVKYTDSSGATHVANLQNRTLQNEVILSAGALGSPQLLMLSGVGACEHLAEFNISCIAELRDVGEHMVDNPINALVVVYPQPLEISLLSVAGISAEGSIIEGASGENWTWQWPGMGELNIFPPEERSPEAVRLMQKNLRNLSSEIKSQIDQSSFVLSKVYEPLSKGNLRLVTPDVTLNPLVEFNYYSHPEDIETCIAGAEYMQKLLRAPSFQNYRYTAVTPLIAMLYPQLSSSVGNRTDGAYMPNLHNRTATAEWCRDTVTTVWHFHGGCTRGKVVDRKYRMVGVRSLRVVDGSTFTRSPGTNPQATVMMLGRYVRVNM